MAVTEQVTFHVEDEVGHGALLRAVCRVVDAHWQQQPKARLLVRVDDAAMSQRLDEALWSFRDDAFIPHATANADNADAPVLIAHEGLETLDLSLAIDHFLDATAMTPIAACVDRFRHVGVVLDGDGERRAAGRERFREWRQAGLAPQMQPLA